MKIKYFSLMLMWSIVWASTIVMAYLLIRIMKYGKIIVSEPNHLILISEIILSLWAMIMLGIHFVYSIQLMAKEEEKDL